MDRGEEIEAAAKITAKLIAECERFMRDSIGLLEWPELVRPESVKSDLVWGIVETAYERIKEKYPPYS